MIRLWQTWKTFGVLCVLTPIGKPPPLAVRLAEALPFRRAQGSEEKRPIHIRPPAYGRGVPET